MHLHFLEVFYFGQVGRPLPVTTLVYPRFWNKRIFRTERNHLNDLAFINEETEALREQMISLLLSHSWIVSLQRFLILIPVVSSTRTLHINWF